MGAALAALSGADQLTAATLTVDAGPSSRFEAKGTLMSDCGLAPGACSP